MLQEVKTGLTKQVSQLQTELEQAVKHRQTANKLLEANRKKAVVGTAALSTYLYQSVMLTLL